MRIASIRTVGMLASVLAALAIGLALLAMTASASPYCGGQVVNSGHTCFGAQRAMSGANAYGETTSVCVGADTISGSCSPGPNQYAIVNVSSGQHVPWVRGNAGSNTIAWGNTF